MEVITIRVATTIVREVGKKSVKDSIKGNVPMACHVDMTIDVPFLSVVNLATGPIFVDSGTKRIKTRLQSKKHQMQTITIAIRKSNLHIT